MTACALRRRLDEARRTSGLSMGDLSVLSSRKDPFRLDTPAMHRDGAWVAEQIQRLRLRMPVHLRGAHYALVASGDTVKPDGTVYTNTEEDWTWLADIAAKAARFLGYVPFEAIIDNRNEEPAIFVPERTEPEASVYFAFDFQIPELQQLTPRAHLARFRPRQAYRLSLCGEKASLRSVLEPIAKRYGAELVLPTGEMSDTLVHGIAKRAAADGRPLRVFYFADFDPAGWQMPVSVARKLQAMCDLVPDMPHVQVHRVAMTVDQVRDLGLPSTPLKATERRGDRWRARWGCEQTEIDALAQLRPRELERIANAAIEPFFDHRLDNRAFQAANAWEEAAAQALEDTVGPDWLKAKRADLETMIEEIRPRLDELQREMRVDPEGIDLPAIPEVEPNLEGKPCAPRPLFDSGDDWTAATKRLVEDKALAGEVEA